MLFPNQLPCDAFLSVTQAAFYKCRISSGPIKTVPASEA